jgi:tetratricopeptide (TPR) repeat protein
MMQTSDEQVSARHHLTVAAEGGDIRAMVLLAQDLHRDSLTDDAKRWAHEAAELGDAEAMHCLSQWGESRRWEVKAAEAGHADAIWSLVITSTTAEERERWLLRGATLGDRRLRDELLRLLRQQQRFDDAEPWQWAAAEDGDGSEQFRLGQRLVVQGDLDQAEHWFRTAADGAGTWASLSAAQALARLLADQGRLEQAEHWLTMIAWSDRRQPSLEAARELDRLLAIQGRLDEAAQWRHLATAIENRLDDPLVLPFPAYGGVPEVVVTALVTTAVLPFVQALASKAAGDAYAQARTLIGRLSLRRPGVRNGGGGGGSAANAEAQEAARFVVVDDPEIGITAYLSAEVSDEALRALAALDLGELTVRRPDEGRVRLIWHQASGTWRIRGEVSRPPVPPPA